MLFRLQIQRNVILWYLWFFISLFATYWPVKSIKQQFCNELKQFQNFFFHFKHFLTWHGFYFQLTSKNWLPKITLKRQLKCDEQGLVLLVCFLSLSSSKNRVGWLLTFPFKIFWKFECWRGVKKNAKNLQNLGIKAWNTIATNMSCLCNESGKSMFVD